MDSSFTDYEKRFVLAEMIKASPLDWKILRDFLRAHEVEPDLLAMQLPPGRNMHQCIHAAETMEMHLRVPELPRALSVPKRKSTSDLNERVSKRQAVPSPLQPAPASTPASSSYGQSRSFGGLPPGSALPPPLPTAFPMPGPPRASQNGYSSVAISPPQPAPTPSGPISTPTVLPTRRKRGRPSKADMEARARERVNSRATGYQPIKAAPVPIAPLPGYQIASTQFSDQNPPKAGSTPAGNRLGKPDAMRVLQGASILMPEKDSGSTQAPVTAPGPAARPSQPVPSAPPADMGISTEEPEQRPNPVSIPKELPKDQRLGDSGSD